MLGGLDALDYASIILLFGVVGSAVLAGLGKYARHIGAVSKR